MTRADRVLVAVILVASACLAFAAVPGLAGSADEVLVSGPSGDTTLDLALDAEYPIDGELGPVVVSVSDGQVRVVESSCAGQRCVRSAAIDGLSGAIVCLPNGVTVSPVSREDIDCVVR